MIINLHTNLTLQVQEDIFIEKDDEKVKFLITKWKHNKNIDYQFLEQFLINNKVIFERHIDDGSGYITYYFKQDQNKHIDYIKEQTEQFIKKLKGE